MYKGAGIVFYKKINNKIFISLGKRAISRHKNYWSIPGGKMSSVDNNDFLKCAFRETKEEYFHNNYKIFKRIIPNVLPSKESRLIIPFVFEYWTFLIDLSNVDIEFSNNWEFSEVKWFEIDKLPNKTHFGVKYSLFKFKF